MLLGSNLIMEDHLENTLRHEMAFAFWDDARDLRQLFDLAWREHENFTKTGRIKIVLNLVMACECALKAHLVLSRPETPPKILLDEIKRVGHNTTRLSKLTTYMQDPHTYNEIRTLLDPIRVEVRYSFNAAHTYFRANETYNLHATTISNPDWVQQVREHLDVLIDAGRDAVTGFVENDMGVLLQMEKAIDDLIPQRPKR